MHGDVASIRRERMVRTVTVMLIIAVCLFTLLKVNHLLISLITAFIIYYLAGPPVTFLERTGLKRRTAVILIFICAGGLCFFLTIMIVPIIGRQVSAIRTELPETIEGVTRLIRDIETNIHLFSHGMITYDIGTTAETTMKAMSVKLFEGLPAFLSVLLQSMILAPLFAFFMLIDGQKAVKRLLSLVPNHLFESALNLQYQINVQIGGFIRARLLEATIVGIVIWIGLTLLHFPYALFFAFFAGLTNLIPYIGPVIGAIPALVIGIVKGFPGLDIAYVGAVFAMAQLIDNILIVPMVVAKIVNLHAVVVIVVVMIGAQATGIIGMIVSIPTASILKLTAITVYQHLTRRHV